METKRFSFTYFGTPNKNGQQENGRLSAILLPSKIAVIKTEAPIKRTEPEHQGNAPSDLHAKGPPKESAKIVAHVYEVPPASAKYDPSLPDFCHPDVLITWQQSALDSEKLR